MSYQRKLLVVAIFIYLEHRSFRPKGKTLKAKQELYTIVDSILLKLIYSATDNYYW